MTRIGISSRGNRVDFDLLAVKSKMAQVAKPQPVKDRSDIIQKKHARKVNRAIANLNVDDKLEEIEETETETETVKPKKRKINKRKG